MLRPLPRPPPSPSSETTTTGRWWRSTSREATIPTTPGMPVLAGEHQARALRAAASGSSRRAASAAVSTSRSVARRSEFARPSSTAISSARASSSVSISSTPASARYSRPAALIRGANRNARSPSSSCVGSHFEAAINARNPGRRVLPHLHQPPPDQRPVLPDQRHHVGDRRQRHQVEVALAVLPQRTSQLPSNRRPAQRGETGNR